VELRVGESVELKPADNNTAGNSAQSSRLSTVKVPPYFSRAGWIAEDLSELAPRFFEMTSKACAAACIYFLRLLTASALIPFT